MIETRFRWEHEALPEGWRFCHTDYDHVTGETWALWTNAPEHENPHENEIKWIQLRRITQHRVVTEWVDV